MDIIDIAWAAGFFDGEGCIILHHVKGSFSLRISASQKRVEPLEKLQSIFGGTIQPPFKGSSTYGWYLYSKNAAEALKAMLPFLLVKKDQAEIAVSFQERKSIRYSYDSVSKEADRQDYILLRSLKVA